MELSDYDLLGIDQNVTFTTVKSAYYELSRIYHPDSCYITGLSKDSKLIAFKRIRQAFENIKRKMNIVEIDLPHYQIEYETEFLIKKSNKINIDDKNFNQKFNQEFDKLSKIENLDNPYSIYYSEPDECDKNLQDTKIILREYSSIKSSNLLELGVNYIEDHSCEKYTDFKKFQNLEINIESLENYKEAKDTNLEEKLENLLFERSKNIILSKSEKEFIDTQNDIKNKIEQSKLKIYNERQKLLIDS